LLTALNDLVEFTSIKPNATTLGAVVNFDTLTLSHYQRDIFANWALHNLASSFK